MLCLLRVYRYIGRFRIFRACLQHHKAVGWCHDGHDGHDASLGKFFHFCGLAFVRYSSTQNPPSGRYSCSYREQSPLANLISPSLFELHAITNNHGECCMYLFGKCSGNLSTEFFLHASEEYDRSRSPLQSSGIIVRRCPARSIHCVLMISSAASARCSWSVSNGLHVHRHCLGLVALSVFQV